MSHVLRFALTMCVRCRHPVLSDQRAETRAGHVWHERCPQQISQHSNTNTMGAAEGVGD